MALLAGTSLRRKDEAAPTEEQPAVEITIVSTAAQAPDYYLWPTQPPARAVELGPTTSTGKPLQSHSACWPRRPLRKQQRRIPER